MAKPTKSTEVVSEENDVNARFDEMENKINKMFEKIFGQEKQEKQEKQETKPEQPEGEKNVLQILGILK
jgi:hypothetical protein